jgi:hypothetical protein
VPRGIRERAANLLGELSPAPRLNGKGHGVYAKRRVNLCDREQARALSGALSGALKLAGDHARSGSELGAD